MFKILAMSLMLSLGQGILPAADNVSRINFTKDISADTINTFYEFAIEEYNNSNYGFSRDLFTAITNRTTVHPECYYYLGKIYSEVPTLKDKVLANIYFLRAANSLNLDTHIRQEAYLALAKMSNNDDVALRYAKDSLDLINNDKAKKALVSIYQKKYEKTKDKNYLDRASIVMQSLNMSWEPSSTIPVNYGITLGR